MKKISLILTAIVSMVAGVSSCSNEEPDTITISSTKEYNTLVGSYVGTTGDKLNITKDSLSLNQNSYAYVIVNDSILAINGQGTKYSYENGTLRLYIDATYYWEFTKTIK